MIYVIGRQTKNGSIEYVKNNKEGITKKISNANLYNTIQGAKRSISSIFKGRRRRPFKDLDETQFNVIPVRLEHMGNRNGKPILALTRTEAIQRAKKAIENDIVVRVYEKDTDLWEGSTDKERVEDLFEKENEFFLIDETMTVSFRKVH